MKTALYLLVIIGALYVVQRCGPPLIGDADARGPAHTVETWPWE
jgi:hypothetical protein